MEARSHQDAQEATFRCSECNQRLGGLEAAKSGERATGAALGRVIHFTDGQVFARCRCGVDTPLPLEIRVTFIAPVDDDAD